MEQVMIPSLTHENNGNVRKPPELQKITKMSEVQMSWSPLTPSQLADRAPTAGSPHKVPDLNLQHKKTLKHSDMGCQTPKQDLENEESNLDQNEKPIVDVEMKIQKNRNTTEQTELHNPSPNDAVQHQNTLPAVNDYDVHHENYNNAEILTDLLVTDDEQDKPRSALKFNTKAVKSQGINRMNSVTSPKSVNWSPQSHQRQQNLKLSTSNNRRLVVIPTEYDTN